MVSQVSELDRARIEIGKELERARRQGSAVPQSVEVGAMLEVPSLLFELKQILGKADFLSIGSNDLLQFVFAADRTNPTVSRRYDALSPAVLSLVRHVTRIAAEVGRSNSLAVCGEIAGRPLEAIALVGLGITSLSMQASAIGPVKMALRGLDTRLLRPVLDEFCDASASTIRDQLTRFATEHGIDIGRIAQSPEIRKN
jgi:phosphotransferase system enzyme I (PtsP)